MESKGLEKVEGGKAREREELKWGQGKTGRREKSKTSEGQGVGELR